MFCRHVSPRQLGLTKPHTQHCTLITCSISHSCEQVVWIFCWQTSEISSENQELTTFFPPLINKYWISVGFNLSFSFRLPRLKVTVFAVDVAGVSRDVLPVCLPPSGTSSRSHDKVSNCGLFLYQLPPPGQADLDLIRLNLLPWACLEKKEEKKKNNNPPLGN